MLKNKVGIYGQRIINYYLEQYEQDIEQIIDVSQHKEYQLKDIDFIIKYKDGREEKIEIKTDEWIHKTNNIFVETISNDVKGTKGCFLTSEADYFYYYDILSDDLYVFNLKEAREWFLKNKEKFPKKITSTKAGGKVIYNSEGYLVNKDVFMENITDGYIVEKILETKKTIIELEEKENDK